MRRFLNGFSKQCPRCTQFFDRSGEYAVLASDGDPCIVEVLTGVDVVLRVNFGDTPTDEFIPIEDPVQHTLSLPIPAHVPFDTPTSHFVSNENYVASLVYC